MLYLVVPAVGIPLFFLEQSKKFNRMPEPWTVQHLETKKVSTLMFHL